MKSNEIAYVFCRLNYAKCPTWPQHIIWLRKKSKVRQIFRLLSAFYGFGHKTRSISCVYVDGLPGLNCSSCCSCNRAQSVETMPESPILASDKLWVNRFEWVWHENLFGSLGSCFIWALICTTVWCMLPLSLSRSFCLFVWRSGWFRCKAASWIIYASPAAAAVAKNTRTEVSSMRCLLS